jgi:hypothetical protein
VLDETWSLIEINRLLRLLSADTLAASELRTSVDARNNEKLAESERSCLIMYIYIANAVHVLLLSGYFY